MARRADAKRRLSMKPGRCPDMPFYVNHWLSSAAVAAMTPEQEGAFFHLICHAWNLPDCALPDDEKTLASLSRLGATRWKKVGGLIRAQFLARNGRLSVRWQKQIRRDQDARVKASRAQRSGAARARWTKQWAAKRKAKFPMRAAMRPRCGSRAAKHPARMPLLSSLLHQPPPHQHRPLFPYPKSKPCLPDLAGRTWQRSSTNTTRPTAGGK